MTDCKSAIAPTFTVDVAESFDLTFSSGTSPVTVTISAKSYRMCLAPSSGTSADYLRSVQTAINSALSGAGRTETATVDLDANTGIASISILTASWSAAENSGFPLRRLGFGSSIATVSTTATATRPVLYLALFVERVHVGWQTRQVISQGETAGGVAYGIRSGVSRADDEITFGFVPRDPTIRAEISAPQTALNPDGSYTNAVATPAAREWSVLDVLGACVGQTVAFALGNWPDVAKSTTLRYDIGAVRQAGIAEPRVERVRDGWDRYYRITIPVTRSSTGTRA